MHPRCWRAIRSLDVQTTPHLSLTLLRMTPLTDLGQLTERLRDRVVGALHVGRAKAGDRLPGVREVAREIGADPRTVAKAYRELEREGLVEVRGRSGVYAARQDHWGGTLLAETGRWLGGIVLEAWKRHIPVPDLADLIRHCTQNTGLRAVAVDAVEDCRYGLCAELEESFGIPCTALSPDDFPVLGGTDATASAALDAADFVVTTPYHQGTVRRATAGHVAVVAATLHPDLGTAVERRLRKGELTVVCVDAAFGEQLRSLYPPQAPERLRIVALADGADVAALDPNDPVLLTQAARARIGDTKLKPLLPFRPFISPESALEIAELMIRLHMEARHAGS